MARYIYYFLKSISTVIQVNNAIIEKRSLLRHALIHSLTHTLAKTLTHTLTPTLTSTLSHTLTLKLNYTLT